MSQPVFRFAPSPNGYLHLGHAYSAILNHDMAKAAGGRFLLRIEDIDFVRCKPEYTKAIFEDLAWLGLEWELPVRRQSDHLNDYQHALDGLKAKGLVYPALLSGQQLKNHSELSNINWPRDPDGQPHYPGTEREWPPEKIGAYLQEGQNYAWRLDIGKALHGHQEAVTWTEFGEGDEQVITRSPTIWGDVILARKDIQTSYHLSVVLDDANQGVTDIVRGRDLFEATSIHRLLQNILGLPQPRYHHHDLVKDGENLKLSKSAHSTSLRQLRSEGATPSFIRKLLNL